MAKFRDAEEQIKKRKAILKTPIIPLPDAPENIRLSKKEFIAKRRKEKENAIKVEAFKESLKEEKVYGVSHEEEKGKEEVTEVKRGRPKKVE